jgi:hypothetical protein
MKIRTTPMRYAAAGPLAAIALTTASVSACGGSIPLAGPSSSSPTSGTSTINVCTLLPSSQVAAIAGDSVLQASPDQDDSFGDHSFACTYTLNSGTMIRILVEVTGSPDAFDANSTGLDGAGAIPLRRVPGVGTKAVASINGLAVLTDKDNILISGVPGEWSGDHAGDIKLARILIAALG